MVLIAIALGVVFAWLVEAAGIWVHGKLGENARRRFRAVGNWIGYLLALCLFVGVASVLVHGLHGRYNGHLESWTVRALYFATVPQLLGVALGFAGGAAAFWLRKRLRRFGSDLAAVFKRDRHAGPAPGDSRKQPGGHANGGTNGGPKEPYPWLTGIVGIAAVTLVAIVTLVVFFPELLMRVESIKVAGVEARFATAANQSVRIAVQAGIEAQSTNDVLNKWAAFDRSNTIGPAQGLVNERWSPRQQGERDAAEEIWTSGDHFFEGIAKPLATLIRCYSREFEIRDTEAQHRAVKIANEWGRVFVTGNDQRLENAVSETYALMVRLDKDIESSGIRCDELKSRQWMRNGEARKVIDRLKPQVARFTTNGYAIAFVAHVYVLTHRPAAVATFMDRMVDRVDKRRGTLMAQLYFYMSKSEAKFAARAPVPETNEDLKQALKLTDEVLAIAKDKKKDTKASAAGAELDLLAENFTIQRIEIINNQLYNLIVEWLQGRRLLPLEMLEFEGLPNGGQAYEVSEGCGSNLLRRCGTETTRAAA